MPLFFEHEVDADTRLAVWHITEEAPYFDVPLQRVISHPHKRLQHLAGRFLLRFLFPDLPLELIRVADTRRPFLEDDAFHFSISHCGDYAAAIVSRSRRVGIDVELPGERVSRIRPKFIGPAEDLRLRGWADAMQPAWADTLLWSVKEAAFKWYGKGQVDFRHDMPIHLVLQQGDHHFRFGLKFGKEVQELLDVSGLILPPLCLAFVASPVNDGFRGY